MQRNSWDKVYHNQRTILAALSDIDDIFLAGGTAIQCYTISKRYRESEDLDFFVDHKMKTGEISTLGSEIIQALRDHNISIVNSAVSEDGTYRIICDVNNNEEPIKIKLLDFTACRLKDLTCISHTDFPRIENNYNLLLYKLKALCDRPDTFKDIFDLYFLFIELGQVSLREMLFDLQLKFKETTGYDYNSSQIMKALKVKRKQDIVLVEDIENKIEMIKAIDEFSEELADIFISRDVEIIDFSYGTYLKKKMLENECDTAEDYLDFFETNSFIESECRDFLSYPPRGEDAKRS